MKKIISIVIVLMLLLSAGCTGHKEPFRLHVVANSDSAADQAVKLQVRDAVLAVTGEGMEASMNKEEAISYMKAHIDEVLEAANGVLKENGMDYTARAEIGVFAFPEKSYGDTTYPAGDYDALRLVLGEGEGQNWWCVMFPPLCLVNTDALTKEEGAETEAEVEVGSAIWDFFVKLFGLGGQHG